ncbi:MAG: exonuclease domain-containing protein [Burkholderiales bacterium]|nr:exonuclease domain-containing protein [Burkholderiales bacterium]
MPAALMPLDSPLAVLDLETTGAHPTHDRITEIAVLEVDDGEVVAEWSTLVNPGRRIPLAIQALTGITDAMVAAAPSFERLAADLYERLAGRVLVAHNARFDYGFLKREFERAGIEYRARTLCTVKLSRRLYPGEASHNLDSVIARHGIGCIARHRALGDAQAVWAFLCAAAAEHGAERLAAEARALLARPALPEALAPDGIDALPDAPGVYLFYGEDGAPLYVGKSARLRERVVAHFAGDLRSAKALELARAVRRVEFRRTCGELGALLAEAALVKALAPRYNRRLREPADLCGFVLKPWGLRLAEADEIDAATVGELHGVFRSRRAALAALRGLADAHGLCLQSLGFEPGARRNGACFRYQIQRCAGLCAGRDSPRAHQARLAAALARLPRLVWPWRGPVGIVERDPVREATELHVVDRWCWLGTAQSDAEVAALLERRAPARFDFDVYRILARGLRDPRAQVIELGRCTWSW